MVLFSELKKGDKIMHSHMGTSPAVSGIIMESPKQGRGVKSTILVNVKGSEVGMFDEIGSIIRTRSWKSSEMAAGSGWTRRSSTRWFVSQILCSRLTLREHSYYVSMG